MRLEGRFLKSSLLYAADMFESKILVNDQQINNDFF